MSETPHADHQRKLEYVRVVNENDELKKRIAELEADVRGRDSAINEKFHMIEDAKKRIAELEDNRDAWRKNAHAASATATGLRERIKELEAKCREFIWGEGDDERPSYQEWNERALKAEAKVEELEALRAEQLAVAWAKYTSFYGQPPHGTVNQLAAMLVLIPAPADADSAASPTEVDNG